MEKGELECWRLDKRCRSTVPGWARAGPGPVPARRGEARRGEARSSGAVVGCRLAAVWLRDAGAGRRLEHVHHHRHGLPPSWTQPTVSRARSMAGHV